ncbi:MAG: protease inhibitor I9 family protein, partial [Gemmatimonadales bacterium]
MALLASAPFLGCSSDTPLAPDADTEQSVVPQSKAVQVVPDEYIVLFEESVADPRGLANQLAAAHGLQIKHHYRYAVKGFAAKIPPQALAGLQNNPRIQSISPNYTYTLNTPETLAITVPTAGLRVRLVADDLAAGDVALWP